MKMKKEIRGRSEKLEKKKDIKRLRNMFEWIRKEKNNKKNKKKQKIRENKRKRKI